MSRNVDWIVVRHSTKLNMLRYGLQGTWTIVFILAIQSVATDYAAVNQNKLSIDYHYYLGDLEGSCIDDINVAGGKLLVAASGCGQWGTFAYLWRSDRFVAQTEVVKDIPFDGFPVGCHTAGISFIQNRGWLLLNCDTRRGGRRHFAYSMVLQTIDGGETWEKLSSDEDKHILVGARRIQFVDNRTGWILSEVNRIFATHDGGRSWLQSIIPVKGIDTEEDEKTLFSRSSMGDFVFVNQDKGWVGTPRGIMFTSNGGKTWTEQYSSLPDHLRVERLFFVDESEGWACRINMLLHTVNGGQRWEQVKIKAPGISADSYRLNDVLFTSRDVGYVVGMFDNREYARILASGEELEDLYMKYRNNSYDRPFLLHTVDGGKSWTYVPLKMILRKLVTSENVVYGVGTGSTIVTIKAK